MWNYTLEGKRKEGEKEDGEGLTSLWSNCKGSFHPEKREPNVRSEKSFCFQTVSTDSNVSFMTYGIYSPRCLSGVSTPPFVFTSNLSIFPLCESPLGRTEKDHPCPGYQPQQFEPQMWLRGVYRRLLTYDLLFREPRFVTTSPRNVSVFRWVRTFWTNRKWFTYLR